MNSTILIGVGCSPVIDLVYKLGSLNDYLQLEDGFNLLFEDGFKLILE